MAPTRESFIAACDREVGYQEQPVNRTKYAELAKHANGYAWCHTFLAGMANREGLNVPDGLQQDGLPDAVAATAYTPTGLAAFRAAGMAGDVPKVGAWAYADFPGDGVNRVSHVWLVTAIHPDGTQSTIEGNTSIGTVGDQREGLWVARRRRANSLVKGYGYPRYGVEAPPPPPPHVIVKAFSVEAQLLALYPDLFGLPVRYVAPEPTPELPWAARNAGDIGFGVPIFLAKASFVGENRYDTLRQAVAAGYVAR
jgi:hypothetical protein